MTVDQYGRPDAPDYFMGIAMAVRRRANCLGSRVGAIIVLQNRIVSTGYNGTPHLMVNCLEGGCERCSNRDKFPAGRAYDVCICVHAEQNALLAAARFGIAVSGGTVFSTMQPCFGCCKEMLQADIHTIYYVHPWVYPEQEMQEQYAQISKMFKGGMHALILEDPDAAWAVSKRRVGLTIVAGDDTGHSPV
ncbi:MAG: dCMP deaminase family protein [Verrucomicrobiota bacterium]|nr:dCMP deaminase family protein [Verrucomicrobiota bacterium]